MPLLDHFHPPLFGQRHWEGFHNRWASAIADALNEALPRDYFAEVQIQVGRSIEVDVGSFESNGAGARHEATSQAGGVATTPWAPPAATLRIPAVFPDAIEVLVFDSSAGPTLVAAVELVSPSNKD